MRNRKVLLGLLENLARAELLRLPEADTSKVDEEIATLESQITDSTPQVVREVLEQAITAAKARREELLTPAGVLNDLVDKYTPEATKSGVRLPIAPGTYSFGRSGGRLYAAVVTESQVHIYRDGQYLLTVPAMSASRLSHVIVSLGKHAAGTATVLDGDVLYNIVKNGQVRSKAAPELELPEPPSNYGVMTVVDRF